jgi:hypothetical protein
VTCQEATELLAAYGTCEPDPTTGWRFRLHLWCCQNCRDYLDSYKTTVRLEKEALQATEGESPTVPEELVASILAAVREK